MSDLDYAQECSSNDGTARFSRLMQFCAGPQRETFYACVEHRESLDQVMTFLPIAGEEVKVVTEEYQCDFCREGGYE